MSIIINQGTQSYVASDLVGTVDYPVMKMDVGAAGATSLFTGTIGAVTNLAGGTITKVEGGTVGLITRVGNVGTVESGSVVMTAGTVSVLNTVGTVGVVNSVAAGTQQTLGTVGVVNNLVTGTLAAVTTLTNLTNGSVILQSGTLTTGSLSNVAMLNAGSVIVTNLNAGTVTSVANLAAGTITSLLSQSAGTLNTLGTVGVVNNLVTGTIAAVTSVTNLASGTLAALASGTVSAGTISVFTKTVGSTILTTHTLGTAGGTTWGTLIAPAGAGTYVYVTGLSIVSRSGTPDCAVATNVAGSTGAGVFARGAFSPSGGIMRNFHTPIQVGTNGTIAYMILNGTADFTVDYWVGP